jgi:hypothetical protein
MNKAFLIASALLLQLSTISLAVQAAPQDKAVGKAATYYRHLEIARGSSKNLANTQMAESAKKPAAEAQVATEQNTQPVASVVTTQPAQNKEATTQASTAK